MKLKTVEITELKGINRNAVEGVSQLQPTSLTGFALDRTGGYRARFGKKVLTTSGSPSGIYIGSDDSGLVTFGDVSGSNSVLSLYDGTSAITTTSGITFNASTSTFYFIENVGVVANLERRDVAAVDYYPTVTIVTRTGAILDANDLQNDLTVSLSEVAGDSLFSSSDEYRVYGQLVVATKKGEFFVTGGDFDDITLSGSTNAIQIDHSFTSTSLPTNTSVYFYAQNLTNNVADVANSTLVGISNAVSGSTTFEAEGPTAEFVGPPYIIQWRGTAVSHQERYYGLAREATTNLLYPYAVNAGGNPYSRVLLNSNNTIVYSKIGTVNAWQNDNYFVPPIHASNTVTGLASSPAGLLVFCDAETFLVRGDPALDSFSVQVASSVIGMDEGTKPVRLGGTVFVIYKGEIYAFALGMGDVDFGSGIANISRPVYEPDKPFVDIASEPESRNLVALLSNDNLLRYDAEAGEWMTDVHRNTDFIDAVFSNPDSDGVRYYTDTNSDFKSAYGSISDPSFIVSDLDFGTKPMHKMFRRVRMHTNDNYTGTPTMGYIIDGQVGTITASEPEAGNFIFTLPAGLVDDKITQVSFNLIGATSTTQVEPPVVFEFVERYRRR